MSDHNLRIWMHAEKTDPSATKSASLDGRQVTSVSTLWPIKKATELWGPMGKGWGVEIVESRYDDAGPIIFDGEHVGTAKNHTIHINLWYKEDGERCYLPAFGHTKYVYGTQKGRIIVDWEADKKSLSDAIKKGLSMLGFMADVFEGQFDDREYVEAAKAAESIKKADDKKEEVNKLVENLTEDAAAVAGQIKTAKTPREAIKLAEAIERKLNNAKKQVPDIQKPVDSLIRRIVTVRAEAIEKLAPNTEESQA